MFPIIPSNVPSAEVFNMISIWLKNTLTQKTPGEIDEESDVDLQFNSNNQMPLQEIIRLDGNLNYSPISSLPEDSEGDPIQIDDLDLNEEEIYVRRNPQQISFLPPPTDISKSILYDIKDCVDDFIMYRTPSLKTKTKSYIYNRLMGDLQTITNFLYSNLNDDFLVNNINDIDLYNCIQGKKISEEKLKRIDEESIANNIKKRNMRRYQFFGNSEEEADQ